MYNRYDYRYDGYFHRAAETERDEDTRQITACSPRMSLTASNATRPLVVMIVYFGELPV